MRPSPTLPVRTSPACPSPGVLRIQYRSALPAVRQVLSSAALAPPTHLAPDKARSLPPALRRRAMRGSSRRSPFIPRQLSILMSVAPAPPPRVRRFTPPPPAATLPLRPARRLWFL